MNRNEIVHLACYNIKIFSLLGVFSTLIFILWGFCPIVLLSIVAFLCPPTWSHDENVDCPHLHHVITWTEMGLYTLIVGVLKYFLFWGFCPLWFLSFGAFVLWCFCPFWRFSVHPCDRMTRMLIVHTCIMWSHEQKWDRTPWLLEFQNIFSFGCFVRFDFYPLDLFSYGAFVHFGFSLSTHVIAWRECWLSTPVSCDHMNRNGIVHLDCWSIKIFSLLVVLSALIFILCSFCPMVLLSILAFLCPPTWSHDENVDCPHLYHVITCSEKIWSYTLIVIVLKYFLFWVFCPLWFLSFGAFVLWCFCPFWRFSVRPRDRMTRMLIVHTCIMWSHEQKWDHTPWLLEY